VNLTQHLVLDLHQVVGIEEVAAVKQRIDDGFRLWVESAMATERLALLLTVGRGGWSHKRYL
jgi:hypothetical protein